MSSKVNSLKIKRPSLDISDDKNIIEENYEGEEEEEEEEEEEISQDLPSFKSVIFKGNNSVVQSLETQGNKNVFFDAEKGQYVNVDNFAFTEDIGNYFETKSQSDGGSSSLALLDSR